MGSLKKFRKAVGALKDSTTVSLAKVNSEFSELDVAIVKATNHVEAPPGERHVRKILAATSALQPRADVAYCIHALTRRLNKTRNWIVAVKVLIVIHRALREGDPTFREELMNYSHKARILNIANFKDDSSPFAWDCSAWTRTYAIFLEERLECFRVLRYDIETEHMYKSSPSETKVHSRTRFLDSNELLEHLPALQHLLYRLGGCQPEGAACTSYLIQYALALVLKDSFKVYCAINDGIINLVDTYFEMTKYDAVKALHIYKRAGQQADMLSDFYDFCRRLELARNFQFPILRQPPPSFRATMEEYVREAPQIPPASQRRLVRKLIYNCCVKLREYHDEDESPHKEESQEDVQEEVEVEEEKEPEEKKEDPESKALVESDPPPIESSEVDLLGLNEINPKAVELEESNALALAIVQPGSDPQSSSFALSDLGGTTGWELALVTTPSNNVSLMTESKLAGGFDKLLLDSLYEDEAARRQIELQNAGYGYGNGVTMQNPFKQQQDPFAMSNGIAPPTNVQMAMLAQQQQTLQQYQMFQQPQNFQQSLFQMQPQNTMMVPYQSQYSQQHILGSSSSYNPFGDPFSGLSTNSVPQGGNVGLL